MATNSENNTAVNSFMKGMNTDITYSNVQEGSYLYGQNIRNCSYNYTGDSQSSNTAGSIKPIDGYKEALLTKLPMFAKGDTVLQISKILATTSIRQYGIIVARDIYDNWVVIRFTNSIGTSGEYNEIKDCEVIFRSYSNKAGAVGSLTPAYNQLSGNKVSVVATWETEDNIKLYIADGQHFMKIINIAPSNDEYNEKNSGNVKLFEQFPNVVTKPIIFCGLTYGHLQAGSVQYSYRFYKKRGNVSQMSVPTKPIQLGVGFGDGDVISKNSKGGLYQDVINCGVKLKIPLENENPLLDHILIYRIFHYKNGQTPEISLIYDRAVQVTTDNSGSYMSFTDVGQESLQNISLDEYNNISGVYVIPKVIESKNDILFAANIKDDQATLDEIGRMFDARAFRVNKNNDVVLKDGYGTLTENIDLHLKKRLQLDENLRMIVDMEDQFNPYNDINKRFAPTDDVCKYWIKDDKRYYGGQGNFVSWEFIITNVVGDYSKSEKNQIGSSHIGIDYKFEDNDDFKWSKCSNTPISYRVYNTENTENVIEIVDSIDLSDQFEPNNDNGTYANPCISYGLKSLRRDELYRYAIILYNAKGEHTPALWIDDIRTPSISEPCFQTYSSNGTHLDGGTREANHVELTVHPLGIKFYVRVDRFNEDILKPKFGDDYENKKIVSYEIVRCRRTQNDVQTIAQGVLSRPIKRRVSELDYTLLDNVYTPTGSLTTQQFWTGELWQANNAYYNLASGSENVGLPEADNFDNHTLYQFICPECVYTKDNFDSIIQHTQTYLSPISYVFGHHAGSESLEVDGKTGGTYPQLMRGFDLREASSNGNKDVLCYNYIGSSICGHNLALPLKAYCNALSDAPSLGDDYFDISDDYLGYYYKDSYPPYVLNDYKKGLTPRAIPSKVGDVANDRDFGKLTYLRGFQGMFIDQAFSRNKISYYQQVPWDINKFYGQATGNNDKVYYRKHDQRKGIVTYMKLNSIDSGYDTWNEKNTLNNKINNNTIGYTKLYEQSFDLIQRRYTKPESKDEEKEDGEKEYPSDVQRIVDRFGLPFTHDTLNLQNFKDQYFVNNCSVFSQIEWSNLIDSTTNDNKKSYSAKYTDYARAVGTNQYCNVVDGGTYNDILHTLTTDKGEGWFYESTQVDRLDDYEPRGALFGTGGSCLLLELKDDNILYKTICTNNVYRPFDTTKKTTANFYRGAAYNLSESLSGKLLPNSNIYPKQILDIDPDGWTSNSNTKTKSYFSSDAYDYVDCIIEPPATTTGPISKVAIFRSSIAGTFLCNLRQSTIPYGGYSYSARCLNSYVSFGDVKDVAYRVATVFDGDCYIQPFEYQSCHKTYHKDMPFTVTAGLFYAIPVETNINVAMSSGMELSRQNLNSASNIQEEPTNIMDLWVQEKPEYEYNTAYSVQPEVHSIEASDLSTDSNTLEYVDYRCYYSDTKTNNENYDSWTVFKPANFLDADDRCGEITNLRAFNNLLIFWQEHAVGQFSVNERTQITDESGKSLVLGTGGVLSRYDYIDQKSGMLKEQYCDTISKTALYWYDDANNEIKQSNGSSIESITKQQGVQNIMNQHSGILSPVLFFDYKYNEVVARTLETGNGQSIVYNENIGAFTSVYDTKFYEKISFPNGTYLIDIDNGDIKINQWNVKEDGVIGEAKIKYVVNQYPQITKVFDNQEIITENPVTPNQYDLFKFKWNTEFMNCEGPINSTSREGNFRYAIPRSGNEPYGNRMRGKYMVCEMTWPDSSSEKTKRLKDVSILYITTKFRQSCS